ncbi:g12788 [Coccomyxa viridis]|uniref:G12788 protein n=1 Tax=Coccomyxa viridis TaxID=1274662 RepID=A0ABP1GCB0_9CHLO
MPGIVGEAPGAMAQLPALTPGIVRRIAETQANIGPATLQVIGIKNLGAGQEGKPRHRFALSDGELWLTGVPASQIQHLVPEGILQTNVIVRLNDYIFNTVNSKKVLIILGLDVLGQADTVGSPQEYDKVAAGMVAQPPAGGPAHYMNGRVNQGGPARYGPGPQGNLPADNGAAPAASGVYGVNPASRGPYGAPAGVAGYGAPLQNQGGGGGYGNGQGYGQSRGPYGGPANAAAAPGGGYGSYGGGAAAPGGYSGGGNSSAGGGGYGGYGQGPSYKGAGAIARNEAPPRIVPIASLNSYQNHWTIKARITQKSDIKRYSNARGEGKLFSFELLDAQGGEIRGCGFNQCVDKFEPLMQQGAVIMLSKANLKNKRPNSNFNNTRHDYEITLEPSSIVELCPDEEAVIPKIQYHLRKISDLNDMFANEMVDVLGVIDTVQDSAIIQTKDGRDLWKRNVSIRDDSGSSVEVTLWGGYAQEPGDALQEAVAEGRHPIVAIKNAKVGDYNGRTLSTTSSSSVTLDPDIPEAGHLRQWYDSGGAAAGVTTLTSGGTGGGGSKAHLAQAVAALVMPTVLKQRLKHLLHRAGMTAVAQWPAWYDSGGAAAGVTTLTSGGGGGGGKADRRITLAMIKDEGMGAGGATSWVQVAAWLTHIKTDTIAYPACTLQYNGKQCNKKVVEASSGDGPGQWYCDRCTAHCQAEWRYMLNLRLEDHTGTEWVTAFQEEAKALVGRSAEEMQQLKDAASPEFDSILASVSFKPCVFKMRISEETWNEEQRIRINVSRIDPLDFAKESVGLLDLIDRLTLGQPILQPPAQGGGGYGGRQPGAAPGPYQGYGGGENQGFQGSYGGVPKQETSPYSRAPVAGGAGNFGGQGYGGAPSYGGGNQQYGARGGYGGSNAGGHSSYGGQQGNGYGNTGGGYGGGGF